MGILDGVFGGESGVTGLLHRLLGGLATIKTATTTRDETTGRVTTTYAEYDVPFIPKSDEKTVSPLTAPGTSRSDLRSGAASLSGTIPSYAVTAQIRPEKDKIVYNGVEFLITAADTVNIGQTPVQIAITARRV